LNPSAAELPNCSALLYGAARKYEVNNHRTTLSLKSVRRGAALYATSQAESLVTDDCFLMLNLGQEYALEFQGPQVTETLCPFFQPGFLEHVGGSQLMSIERQIDDLDVLPMTGDFQEHLYPKTGRVADEQGLAILLQLSHAPLVIGK